MIRQFWSDEQGQDMIEYSLLLAFLCLFGVASYQAVNGSLTTIWGNAKTTAASAATTSGT
jgi:Flp pilus assembly pilin Flp